MHVAKVTFSKVSLRRVTSTGEYIPEIDALRFWAIIPVLLLHFNTAYKRIFVNEIPSDYANSFLDTLFGVSGWGVELFFAISGFVISGPFFTSYTKGESPSYKKYIIRRITRIEPPFLIATVILFLGGILFENFSFIEGVPHFFATLFYIHWIIYGKWSIINPVTWSLEVEIQFYLLFPFFFSLFHRYKRKIIIISVILLYVGSIFFYLTPFYKFNLQKSVFTCLHFFLMGIAFAYIKMKGGAFFIKRSYVYDCFFIAIIPLIYFSKITDELLLFDFFIFLMFLSVFKLQALRKIVNHSFFTTIGGMCYSIYLIHYSTIHLILGQLKKINWMNNFKLYPLILIITFSLTLVISALFFLLFEKPFMKNFFAKK